MAEEGVQNSYLDRLIQENDALRARSGDRIRSAPEPAPEPTPTSPATDHFEEPTRNPLMDERPWFLPVNSSRIPILIGEVADPAFATRIRQTISKRPQNHIPRTAYPANDPVPNCVLPELNHVHARFLLKTALAYFDGRYHIVRKSATWSLFGKYIQAPASLDPLSKCKISALFAFGELYSSQGKTSPDGVPGMVFFKDASKAYGALHERPTTDYVETCLILVSILQLRMGAYVFPLSFSLLLKGALGSVLATRQQASFCILLSQLRHSALHRHGVTLQRTGLSNS